LYNRPKWPQYQGLRYLGTQSHPTNNNNNNNNNRWVDSIKMDLRAIDWDGIDWIDLAQDMDQWRVLVNLVMNRWVP
jgi:hypothetical protein